ncbi:DUF1540 domain-containing protein [Pseudalkalibacillus caeni]|uniref:DUF1540 domain-containing protein n=1 Tax=Exobacillus caeni TaxID=2574798 RepID=A0A5R9F8T0_9BACL|nr:DUF1540 domain-containing protein [Pseudalkalibacillus caeni]TLS37253.1 DUF1540 domain-containing protein [Pseudalkalibacillus caeni]
MIKPGVKCVVSTCTHYLYGDRCGAGNIDILHEEETHMSEIAENTMCKTFSHNARILNYVSSADNVNWTGSIAGLLDPEYEVTPTIRCTVASCKYWGEGAVCIAEAIEVSGRNSDECQDTNCETFLRRDDDGL